MGRRLAAEAVPEDAPPLRASALAGALECGLSGHFSYVLGALSTCVLGG